MHSEISATLIPSATLANSFSIFQIFSTNSAKSLHICIIAGNVTSLVYKLLFLPVLSSLHCSSVQINVFFFLGVFVVIMVDFGDSLVKLKIFVVDAVLSSILRFFPKKVPVFLNSRRWYSVEGRHWCFRRLYYILKWLVWGNVEEMEVTQQWQQDMSANILNPAISLIWFFYFPPWCVGRRPKHAPNNTALVEKASRGVKGSSLSLSLKQVRPAAGGRSCLWRAVRAQSCCVYDWTSRSRSLFVNCSESVWTNLLFLFAAHFHFNWFQFSNKSIQGKRWNKKFKQHFL